MQAASDEPDAVRRFAGRMQAESQRLTNLVNDLIDLSRLQGGDQLADAEPVAVDALVAEAVDGAPADRRRRARSTSSSAPSAAVSVSGRRASW